MDRTYIEVSVAIKLLLSANTKPESPRGNRLLLV
jgi:hypothetical protein